MVFANARAFEREVGEAVTIGVGELDACEDLVVTMVVLDLHARADDIVDAPYVAAFTTFATAEDAGSEAILDAGDTADDLCGVLREVEVATIGQITADASQACGIDRQVLIADAQTDAVDVDPECLVDGDVEGGEVGSGDEGTLVVVDVGLLEPACSSYLIVVGQILVAVGCEEISGLELRDAAQIIEGIGGESLGVALIDVATVDVLLELVGREAVGDDLTTKATTLLELYDTGAAVVLNMSPSGEDGRVGSCLPVGHHVGVARETVGVEVPHTVVVFAQAGAFEREVVEAVVVGVVTLDACKEGVGAMVVGNGLTGTDDGVDTPNVAAYTAFAITEDAGGVHVVDAGNTVDELGGVLGEIEVTTIDRIVADVAKNLAVERQVLVALADADTVDVDPKGGEHLGVERCNLIGSDEGTGALEDVVLLEPFGGSNLIVVGQLAVTVGSEHIAYHHRAGGRHLRSFDIDIDRLAKRHESVGRGVLDREGEVLAIGAEHDVAGLAGIDGGLHLVVAIDNVRGGTGHCIPGECQLATVEGGSEARDGGQTLVGCAWQFDIATGREEGDARDECSNNILISRFHN